MCSLCCSMRVPPSIVYVSLWIGLATGCRCRRGKRRVLFGGPNHLSCTHSLIHACRCCLAAYLENAQPIDGATYIGLRASQLPCRRERKKSLARSQKCDPPSHPNSHRITASSKKKKKQQRLENVKHHPIDSHNAIKYRLHTGDHARATLHSLASATKSRTSYFHGPACCVQKIS